MKIQQNLSSETSITHVVMPRWLMPLWQQFTLAIDQNRLPHAVMLVGQEGLGQTELVQHMVARLMCLAPVANGGCGACERCQLLRAQTHPDFLLLAPEENATTIKIDAVRSLLERLQDKSYLGGYRVIYLADAAQLTIGASNALLKTLEEPSAQQFFILAAHQLGRILPTIRSRCRLLRLPKPSRVEGIEYLASPDAEHLWAYSHGAPSEIIKLQAQLASAREIGAKLSALWLGLQSLSTTCEKVYSAFPVVLNYLINWTFAIIRYKLSEKRLDGWLAEFVDLSTIRVGTPALFHFLDKLFLMKKNCDIKKIALNKELMTLQLLIEWQALAS